jgi:hypothetical protein
LVQRTARNAEPVEGAAEFAPVDKARFYRIARRFGTESAVVLDLARVLALTTPDMLDRARSLLLRITAMLTAMVSKLRQSGSGSGSGSIRGQSFEDAP